MIDELLVVRAQLGERAALAELVARWRVPIWTYVRRMLDAERADDMTQEIWPAVVRGLSRLREPGRFVPWLFTIARRSVTDRLRSEYAQEREILVLFYLEDLSVEDRARICQVPVGTVKSRLDRARRLLREHLDGKGHRP
ncbi:RNA polymerase sigma factor [Nonomuraea sp. NPDC049714]|uniref:RNA polymerase sigma factor n=1 Tax=Nonomuraea sp. NPDC049714 TaxID=3364357 RepID=UPI00379F321E